MSLSVDVITLDGLAHQEQANSVNLPGVKCPFQVLNDHACMISELGTGIIQIDTDKNQKIHFLVSDGFVNIRDNQVTVLADKIYSPGDIKKEVAEENILVLKQEKTTSQQELEKRTKQLHFYQQYLALVSITSDSS